MYIYKKSVYIYKNIVLLLDTSVYIYKIYFLILYIINKKAA